MKIKRMIIIKIQHNNKNAINKKEISSIIKNTKKLQ